MLAALGFATIGVFLLLTMTKRLSVLVALVLVPVAAAVVGGFAGELGDLVAEGMLTVAPVAIMITFAVLYFSLMVDEGLFDPAIRRILRWAKGDPMKITVGTAVLTLLVALDGDGASTFLITVSAMLPIYNRLGMRPLVLAGVVCLGAGVMNMVPWGGPTARAMAALKVDSSELFVPMLPAMGAGMVWVLFAAYMIGRKERKRVGVQELVPAGAGPGTMLADPRPTSAAQRARFWSNVVLTVALVVALLLQLVHGIPLEVLFAVAFAVALLVNRPRWSQQQELLERHGYNVLLVVSMIFAAGVFTGVLEGTEMVTRMAESLVGLIPAGLSGLLPVITAITGMPLSLVFTPDAYYYGVLPVLSETTAALGGNPVEIGRAAILGQMTTGFPLSPLTASTFILVGMTAVNLGDHQRFIFKWAFGTTLVMTAVALLTGAISL
jgi:CitMHS family citrate-Mg2+:H+ or citrate-Ca2+:H+ symporter